MNHFPVSNSNLSAKHIEPFLHQQYRLPENTTCVFIRAGINDTYLADTGDEKFIFRVYSFNWRTEQQVLEEIKLLNLLTDNKVPVSYPVKDVNSNYIQTLHAPEGNRFAVLFSFAKGEKLLNYSVEMHYKVGVTMARLHSITQNLKLERVIYTAAVLLKGPLTFIEKYLPSSTAEMDFMLSAQQYLLKAFASVKTQELRYGAVHLDIWFDNMNINSDNEVTIFDFDFCGNGWLCLDIAYYVLQLHSLEKEEIICKEKTDSFLQGYESVCPISDEEKRILPMLGVSLYFFYLGVQCSRFENWSNSFLNETYLKRFINMLVKKYFDKYCSA